MLGLAAVQRCLETLTLATCEGRELGGVGTRVREMVSLTLATCAGDGLTHNGHV